MNVRDLGRLPTEDGGETRYGAIVRADNLRHLTAAGRQALLDHGVRAVIDLRRPDELAADRPGPRSPVGVVNIDLNPVNGALDANIRVAYLDMLERFDGNFARAVGAVARAPEGGVAVHCLVGRDRTGLVSALLLRVVGVGVEPVAADWAESDANLADPLARWIAAAPDADERERRRGWVDDVSPAVMEDVLAELDRRHGTVAEYLRAAGVTDAELELVRARLRG